ncbi:MAG: hypothetical protein IPQ12_10375 [Polaromonas sp.]|nr:hypothetical protein [Polaromonas sp.]
MLQTTYQPNMVDIVFPIEGTTICRHYSHDLQNALQNEMPWISGDEQFSIHPIKLVTGDTDITVLSPQSTMIVRGPRARCEEIKPLSGKALNLSGHVIRLGKSARKRIESVLNLYAHHVVAENANESDFMTKVSEELQILGIRWRTRLRQTPCTRHAHPFTRYFQPNGAWPSA